MQRKSVISHELYVMKAYDILCWAMHLDHEPGGRHEVEVACKVRHVPAKDRFPQPELRYFQGTSINKGLRGSRYLIPEHLPRRDIGHYLSLCSRSVHGSPLCPTAAS